jgi:hypothetical protein
MKSFLMPLLIASLKDLDIPFIKPDISSSGDSLCLSFKFPNSFSPGN